MGLKEDIEAMKEEVKEIKEQSFMYEILQDYKRQNKVKDIIIFVLIGIITLFVAGLVYVFTNYDFTYETTQTSEGNACRGDNCNNGEINYGKGN